MKIGEIVVNFGGMFSGKTEELLRDIRRSKIAGLGVLLIKPRIDDRYSENAVVTHNGDSIVCEVIESYEDLLELDLVGIDVVGIDEGQFFGDEDLIKICQYLKYEGKRVVVSGLDMWSDGSPVMNMAKLVAISNKVRKFNAVCVKSGKNAYISHFLGGNKEEDIEVGGAGEYIALCEEEWFKLR